MRTLLLFVMVTGGLILASYTSGFGVEGALEGGQMYRTDLMMLAATDVNLLTQRAQAENWWIRLQQDSDIFYFQGQERCTACEPALESQFLTAPFLTLDNGLFLVEIDTNAFALTLRPKVDGSGGYEAVLSMRETLEPNAVSNQINEELSALGLNLGSELAFELTAASVSSKTAVPEGVNLEETLYRLTQAANWNSEAMLRGLSLSGLRVRVVIELAEGQSAPVQYNLVVEQTGTNVLRAQVLIPDLIALAQDPAVVDVRPPLQAQPQV